MDFTILSVIPYLSFALAAYAAFQGRFTSIGNAKRDAKVEVLEKQMGLFWSMVEQHMTTVLHSPHSPELDMLLEKYQAGIRLTLEEANDLATRLLTIINTSTELQGNRTGAVFLLAALDMRYDLNINVPPSGGVRPIIGQANTI